jgi:hypothetical protein
MALFRSIFRVLGRHRAEELRRWAASQQGLAFNNGGGRQIGDSTWRVQARSYLQRSSWTLEYPTDLQKAFDHVDRGMLIQVALQKGYPTTALVQSLNSYRWTRRVAYQGILSPSILTGRGIAAGSPAATFELRMSLGPATRQLLEGHASVALCLHVDDLSLTVQREDLASAQQDIDAAISAVHTLLRAPSAGSPPRRSTPSGLDSTMLLVTLANLGDVGKEP